MKKYRKYCPHCANIGRWKCWRYWKFWLYVFGIIVSAVILIIILPTTLLTTFHCPFFGLNTDFTETGQIGDTIGGITAPIVGLLSILLLYKTFGEQQKFNKEQEKFQKQQQKFNESQLEFNKKQLRLDNYNLFVNLENTIADKVHTFTLTYEDGSFSIGLDEIIHQKEKLNSITQESLLRLEKHLIHAQRLISTFLKINCNSALKHGNKQVFYESVKESADLLIEVFECLKSIKFVKASTSSDSQKKFNKLRETLGHDLSKFAIDKNQSTSNSNSLPSCN